MNTTKAITAPTMTSNASTPWMALFVLATVPLFMLQPSIAVTLQTVALLSLAMVALAHMAVADHKHFDTAYLAIKLVAPLHFAMMIWLCVYIGREIGGASFAASYLASIACLFGIVAADAVASAALALVAGSCRSVTGLSLVTLISAKYAGLMGKVE